jgi:quinol monooxygenase YgiN
MLTSCLGIILRAQQDASGTTIGVSSPGGAVIAVVWEFDVKEGRQAEFERLAGADGGRAAIVRRSRSYLGASFIRDQARPTRYLLIEYWSEMVVYEKHREVHRTEMSRLEAERSELLVDARTLGVFTALDVPDRFGPTWSTRHG